MNMLRGKLRYDVERMSLENGVCGRSFRLLPFWFDGDQSLGFICISKSRDVARCDERVGTTASMFELAALQECSKSTLSNPELAACVLR